MSEDVGIMEQNWFAYRHLVMSPLAPAIQIRECRMAFYAGAICLLSEFQDGIRESGGVTEEATKKVATIRKELSTYARERIEEAAKRMATEEN